MTCNFFVISQIDSCKAPKWVVYVGNFGYLYKMKCGVLVFNFSGAYEAGDFLPWLRSQAEDLEELDLRKLEGTCCYCDEEAAAEIARRLPEKLPRLRWLDSGDYHYLSHLLARREKEPFNLVLLDNLQTLTAAGLVGQEVKVVADQLQLGSETVKGDIQLEHASGELALVLTDSNGVKKEIVLGSQAPGRVPFSIDPKALGLAPGSYKIEVKSDSGEYPKVEVAGRVSQVRVSTEGPVLEIAGIGSVPFYNITEFGQAPVAGLL